MLTLLPLAVQGNRCDNVEYARSNYEPCCGHGRFLDRREVCFAAAPVQDEDDRVPSYPKVKSTVSKRCTACARLVDNFQMALLPRLSERQAQLERHHSRSRFAASATVGELEAIVEEEVERICKWPRTHHDRNVRTACNNLVDDRAEEIVLHISNWAREGSYGTGLGADLSATLRPRLCGARELRVCSEDELDELTSVDADEAAKCVSARQPVAARREALRLLTRDSSRRGRQAARCQRHGSGAGAAARVRGAHSGGNPGRRAPPASLCPAARRFAQRPHTSRSRLTARRVHRVLVGAIECAGGRAVAGRRARLCGAHRRARRRRRLARVPVFSRALGRGGRHPRTQ